MMWILPQIQINRNFFSIGKAVLDTPHVSVKEFILAEPYAHEDFVPVLDGQYPVKEE